MLKFGNSSQKIIIKKIVQPSKILSYNYFPAIRFLSYKLSYLMTTLHIAQKNSIAKQVANVLSNGSKSVGYTRSKFNPVYEFQLDGQKHVFSSVRGHLFEYELPPECKSWANYDNKKILTRQVEIQKSFGNDMQSLFRNLQDLSKKAKNLILWLDCDRQGEAIAFQVIQICTKVNRNLKIKRARFSAVTRTDILQAYNNLVQPNQRQSNAVSYRQQIDFRLGCTFTRFQTLFFRQRFPTKQNNVLSYGPCQLPTLGFVVQRYLQNKYFVAEDYYFLTAICVIDQNTGIDLKWTKKNTKDKIAIDLIFTGICERAGDGSFKGKVIKRSKNTKKKYRPYPLTTVELQKISTEKLRMSSAKVMQIAEKLYQRGFISYPRTQTNAFPKTMNLKDLVQRLSGNNQYNNYVGKLLEQGQFMNPKIGNSDDQAHSPIHPVKNINKDQLTHEQWKVYDLISRHFLACCSKDAIGQQFQMLTQIMGQQFKASYLTIKQKNFLQIYPFIKWSNSTLAGQIPEYFDAIVDIGEQKTKPPGYLSQSNLIQLMQKNNIGTDSTIHQHIETIQKRNYAIKTNNTFKPTSLGASLIIAYRNLGLRIAQCDVRRMMEINMEKIATGQANHLNAIQETLDYMLPIYLDLLTKKQRWQQEIGKAMEEHRNLTNIQFLAQIAPGETNNTSNQINRNFSENSNQGFQPSNNTNNQVVCYKCKQPGHYANNCPHRGNQTRPKSNQPRSISNESLTNSRQQSNHNNNNNNRNIPSTNNTMSSLTCYRCNQKGHIAPNCPKSNRKNVKSVDSMNTFKNNKSNYTNNKNYSGTQKTLNNFYGSNNNNNNFHEGIKQKKICGQCGVEGRHPKGSTCPGMKNKNKKNIQKIDFY